MAENENKIRVDAKEAIAQVKEYQTAIKALDLQYKTSGGTVANMVLPQYDQLREKIMASNLSTAQQVTLLTSLFHASNRASVGFTSMATQMKQMYQEQRVGNRTLMEMHRAMSSLSGLIGGGVGAAAGTVIGNFQALEFAINSTSIALSRGGGAGVAFGQMLSGLATPLAVAGGALAAMAMLMDHIINSIGASQDKLDKLNFSKFDYLNKKLEELGKSSNLIPAWLIPLMATGAQPGLIWELWKKSKAKEKEAAELEISRGMLAEMGPSSQYALTPDQLSEQERKGQSAAEKVRQDAIKKLEEGIRLRNAERGYAEDATMGKFRQQVSAGASKLWKPDMLAPSERRRLIRDVYTDIDEGWKIFQDSFSSGISTVASEITLGIGGAFESVFGQANSLLEKFLQSFATKLASGAAEFGLRSLLGMIPGVGPILSGFPLPGGTGSTGGGGGGMEYFGGGQSGGYSQIAGLRQDLRNGMFKIQGNDLVYAVDASRMSIRAREL